MWQLFLGLVLLLGMHSISIVAGGFRERMAAANEPAWKIGYSLVSLAGLILIVHGYGLARQAPDMLYTAPGWLRYVAAVLLLPLFILLLAPYLPGRISRALKHPQLAAVKLWAVAHLLVNGSVADVLLFGAFLIWAVAVRVSQKHRPARRPPGAPEMALNDIVLVVAGLGAYALFLLWLHRAWIGVAPLG